MTARARIRGTVTTAVAVLLASTAMHALLRGTGWVPPVVGVVLVVSAALAAARAVRIPDVLAPLVGLVALLLYLTACYVPGHAFLGFLPTPGSLSDLRQLYDSGVAEARQYASPVYTSPDVDLLAVGGVGLATTVAQLLTTTLRRPTLAGLPLLALLAVPAAERRGGVGLWPFAATAVGYLLLLAQDSEDRAHRWGRVLGAGRSRSLAGEAGGAGAGWRIGALALVGALAIPLAIPRTGHDPINGHGPGDGSSKTTVVDPFTSINGDLRAQGPAHPLLTVQTGRPTYLRLTALEAIDPATDGFGLPMKGLRAGQQQQVTHGLQAPNVGTGAGTTRPATVRIRAVGGYDDNLLPVPQDVTTVGGLSKAWSLDRQTRSIFGAPGTRGLTWTASAQEPTPTADQLRDGDPLSQPVTAGAATGDDPTLFDLPDDLRDVVLPVAQRQTATSSTVYDAMIRLQDYFTSGAFRYSLLAAYPGGAAGYQAFLTRRAGYCQQFASTFVAMARSLGVPARVAVGFIPGEQDTTTGLWTVTNKDAHAWPEVWFPSAGWVRFEPTPREDGGISPPKYPDSSPPPAVGTTPSSSAPTSSAPTGSSAVSSTGKPLPLDTEAAGGPVTGGTGGGGSGTGPAVGAALGALAFLGLLAAPFSVRRFRRRRDLADPGDAEAVWAEVGASAEDHGVRLRASASPRAAGRDLARACGLASDDADGVGAAIRLLVTGVERARYAPPGSARGTTDPGGSLPAAATTVRRALERRHGRLGRVRVWLLPPSTLRAARERLRSGGRGFAEAGTAVDSGVGYVARAGRRLAHRA